MPHQNPQETILCPLQIEAKILRKWGIKAPIRVSGPGGDAIDQTVRNMVRNTNRTHLILAGVAGGLDPAIQAGSAFWISGILNSQGDPMVSKNQFSPQDAPRTTICMVEKPLFSPSAKKTLFESSGAGLVDMEARSFALSCQKIGVKWSIVRGVSDDWRQALPDGAERLVDECGAPRPLRIAGYIMGHPWRIPALWQLSSRTTKAMENVARELKKLDVNRMP